MSSSVIPRQQGDAYQAKIFWLYATRLFLDEAKVVRIEWEKEEAGGFDDVVVHYDPYYIDEENDEKIRTEYYQIKYHVNYTKAFSCVSLTEPEFIGTKKESILQRLQRFSKEINKDVSSYRLIVLNIWGIDQNDPIKKLLHNNGSIQINKLFDGSGERSEMGKIRKMWSEHLGITEEDLIQVIHPLRIIHLSPNSRNLIEQLNDRLVRIGLEPIPVDERSNKYISLIQQLHAANRKSFNKEELKAILEEEKLFIQIKEKDTSHFSIGIRSFRQGTDLLQDEVDQLLCLLASFQGRYLLSELDWGKDIYPKISNLLDSALSSAKPLLIHLDTHLSLAFSAGYCLPSKSGVEVSIVQKTPQGRKIWRPGVNEDKTYNQLWGFNETQINPEEFDIVIAISITHDITHDVIEFVSQNLHNVNSIISAMVFPNPSSSVIKDDSHAYELAKSIVLEIHKIRTQNGRKGQLHVFMAAPNGFAFFMGQLSKILGKLTLYEYDFDKMDVGGYTAVLTLPFQ